MQATALEERLPLLDVLRGFALIGIFLANLVSFLGLYFLSPEQIVALPVWDRVVLFAIDSLVEGKFYALFSVLLGIGFALQMERARSKGSPFLPFWYRRMGVLLAIGLLHMFVIWYGDILTLYAILGLFLPLFMLWSNRRLALAVAILLVLPLIIHVLAGLTGDAAFWGSLSRLAAELRSEWGLEGRSSLSLVRSDSPKEVWMFNALGALQRPMSYLLSGRYFQVLGFFVLGLLLARTVLPLWRRGENLPAKLWVSSMILGLISGGLYGWTKAVSGSYYSTDLFGLFQGLVMHISCLTLMIGYVGAIACLWQERRLRRLLENLALIGRMPLTNYVMQTALGVFVFYGYGFSLIGELSFSLIPLIVLVVLGLQCLIARYWLRSHKQGPLESLWRRLSYAR